MFKRSAAFLLAAVMCLSLCLTGVTVRAEEEKNPVSVSQTNGGTTESGVSGGNNEAAVSKAPVKTLLQRMLECESIGSMKKLYKENETAVKAMTKADLNKIITRYNELAAKEKAEPMALLKIEESKDNAAPAKDDAVPAKDDAVPGKDNAVPGKDDAIPGKDNAVPAKDDAVPGKDDAVPAKDDAVPGKDDAVPGKDDAVPGKDDAVTGKDDAVTDKDDTVPGNDVPDAEAVPSAEAVALYEQFMACETYEAMVTLRDSLTAEQIALFTEEQIEAIDEKAQSLEPEDTEAPLEGSAAPAEPEELTEDSVIHVPPKNVTNVAKPIAYEPQEPQIRQAPAMFAMPFSMTRDTPATFAAPDTPGDGIFTYKKAEPNGDGTYTVTLESYATGSSVITEITQDKPTDIVLVLDQSGSMDDDLTGQGYHRYAGTARQNKNLYKYRHNNSSYYSDPNLYYKMEDGSYIEVSVTYESTSTGTYEKLDPINTPNAGTFLFSVGYWDYRDSLYAKVDGEYAKVTVKKTGSWGDTKYTYKIGDNTIATSKGRDTIPTFTGVDDGCLYVYEAYTTENTYTYFYQKDGQKVVIGTSTGDSTEFGKNDGNPNLYYHADTMKRKAALQEALTNFNNTVYTRAIGPDGTPGTEDDVNHRIAMMGYGSEGTKGNTELFYVEKGSVKADDYGNGISSSSYKAAFQDMNTAAGKTAVDTMVGMLDAEGATRSDLGMDMAQKVLTKNPVSDNRTRVVILFTDGAPTTSTDFSLSVANSTITTADAIKDTGVTVYTVGIFDGANAESAGSKPSSNVSGSSSKFIPACNWYMQRTSSNNGVVQDPSYYMSANNAAALDSIFGQIASHIEEGGSHTKLDEKAVIRDVVTPYFVVKPGTPVTLETYQCTGLDPAAGYIWEKNPDAMGAAAEFTTVHDEQNNLDLDQVNVTGFNFSDNYVGTVTENGKVSYRGSKLVISFVVQPRDGFLGGNGVPTNVSAGVYENSKAELPLKTFEVPTVDVKIPDVNVTTPDVYVYLKGKVNTDKLLANVGVNCGTVSFAPIVTEDGNLAAWQTDYVSIELDFKVPANPLVADSTYEYTATVAPNSSGTYNDPSTDTATGRVNVITPHVNFQDSELNAGETPDYDTQNYISTDWCWFDETTTEAAEPTAEEIVDTRTGVPQLIFSYSPAAAPVYEDTPVKVTASMDNEDVTGFCIFRHNLCSVPGCQWEQVHQEGYHFIVHVATFDLQLTKTVTGGLNDPDDTFVFVLTGDGLELPMNIVLKAGQTITVKGLPVGNYTVTEATGWSLGYTADKTSVNITADSIANGGAAVSFTNTRKDVPLTGSAEVDNRWVATVPVK